LREVLCDIHVPLLSRRTERARALSDRSNRSNRNENLRSSRAIELAGHV
jgi:hypothetical protein